MKKSIMMMVMVLTTMIFVGCSKASKYESLCREAATLMEKAGGPKTDESEIKKEVEEFKKSSSEEQDKLLKQAEELISELKKKDEKKK